MEPADRERVEVEHLGGPLDGLKLFMREPGPADVAISRTTAVTRPEYEGDPRGGRPVYAIYAARKGDGPVVLEYVGQTDENKPYVQRRLRCRGCTTEWVAVIPEAAEYPLECACCAGITVWPE